MFRCLLQFDLLIAGSNAPCYLIVFQLFLRNRLLLLLYRHQQLQYHLLPGDLLELFVLLFERFEYFGSFICAISSLIWLFVASINVSIGWWFLWGIHVLPVGFLNTFFSVFGLIIRSLKCALSLILR